VSQFAAIEARIRQLHAHYTDAVWRKDPDAFGDCFAEDAEWRISGMLFAGRDEIVAGITQIFSNMNRVLMTFRTPELEMSGTGRAIGRTYVTEQCTWQAREPNVSIGRYYEHFVDEGDRWRFSWRLYQLLYTGPADLSGDFIDQPDYGAFPGMPPLDMVPAAHGQAKWGMKTDESAFRLDRGSVPEGSVPE